MSKLQTLRKAKSIHDLSALLGYKASSLSYIVYKIPKEDKYTTFDIKKKGGGTRQIHALNPKLKWLQKQLAALLYDCLKEMESSKPRKNKLSHAFREGFSIVTNAKMHKSKRYVLNMDLKDFFRR